MNHKLIVVALFIVLSTSVITGCGKPDHIEATISGYSKICIDGVSYIKFTPGDTVTVQRAPDGTIVKCDK